MSEDVTGMSQNIHQPPLTPLFHPIKYIQYGFTVLLPVTVSTSGRWFQIFLLPGMLEPTDQYVSKG